MRKKTRKLQAAIHTTTRDGAKQPAIEPPELLLMMETLARWACYDHRHKTFVSPALIKIAARILELQADKTHWMLRPNWPANAFMMGIDAKTFKVFDEIKFKWFWWQLGENGKFRIKLQRELLNSGKAPPEIQPLIITKPYWSPRVKVQKHHAEAVKEGQDKYMKEAIMDHFFV